MNRQHVGLRLQEIRNRNPEITQDALAAELGVSRQHISDLERGAASPTVDELASILKIVGSDLSEFFKSNIPNQYENEDHAELHRKFQDLLESDTPLAYGITVNVNSLHNDLVQNYRPPKADFSTPTHPKKRIKVTGRKGR